MLSAAQIVNYSHVHLPVLVTGIQNEDIFASV
ncbi:hypothetical protein DIKCMJMK_00444 [Shewanella oneidensis]|nr:hypothetical protein [Shewanella oneidensis]